MTDLPANLKVAEVDAADLQALLAAKAQLPPHLAVVLDKVVHGYVALVKVLGHHQVTIAELRRLLGVSGPRRNNEKTKAMLAGHDIVLSPRGQVQTRPRHGYLCRRRCLARRRKSPRPQVRP